MGVVTVRAVMTTACACALMGASALPAASASAADGGATIDTYQYWDGASGIGAFGPQFTSIGQVVTIPSDKSHLTKFNLYLDIDCPGPAVLNGEVYSFNGTKAGREVWESKRRVVQTTEGGEHVKLTFKPTDARVKPGREYLLFVSTSKHYEQSGPDTVAYVGAMFADLLPDTYQVGLYDSGDESEWTTGTWGSVGGEDTDLAVRVWLR